MARKRPTIALKRDRSARNTVRRPAAPARSREGVLARVDWGKVRLWGVSLIFAAIWILLWARAYQLQIIRGPRYAEEARRAHIATEVATGRRGNIVDRNKNVLAKSVEAKSVAVRPAAVKNKEAASRLLASALEIPPARAKQIVTDKRAFVWAARKISPTAAEIIEKAAIPGISLQREYARVYPFRHLAGQLLGFVNVDEKGIEGLELAFNDVLSGQKVRKVLQRDAAGRHLYSGSGTEIEDLTGDDVVLTIDTQVQYFAESALLQSVETFGARWASCLVVDVSGGDILAWAEYPFFNPNAPSRASAFTQRNKTAMDALEQGSTIKPFVIAAALQEKIITPESQYDCEKGRWRLRNVTIRDTSPQEVLTTRDILKHSSNIGMAKIGLELGAPTYHKYLTRLGFGGKTGLPLAGEHRGIVHPLRQWTEVDLASASFGQSFSATMLQMAQAYLCIANDGVKKKLRLVLSGGDAKQDQPAAPEERIFSPEVMREVRDMLRSVVEEKGGSGRRARIEGLVVGGKTGTAQKASGDSYGAGRTASFVGMVPVEQPRYLVLVMLDEPVKNQFGGVVAAPVFKDVALKTMAYHALLPESTPATALEDFARERAAREAGEAGRADADQIASGQAANGVAASGPQADAGETRAELVNVVRPSTKAAAAPSVVGMSMRKAVEAFARHGMVPEVKGNGSVVVRQEPEAGTALPVPGAKPGTASAATPGVKSVLWLGESS
ncbi:MAG: Peptidoglycan D,D-transpeptidase FtsI [Desulfovibrio sp.]